ncbi:Flp family type IVb pilin [Rhodovulum euryhalinum]|uniref:Flp pilus assembly pilin Flp n=1 Tax=Rhodovulum euryhalinum TaxID=35805 RepID=A0A4R2KRD8_9RHOB|nr:pilus assembly protein [Rhodovulum euryhalinum]TCO69185.1 Flp pilus assembly pilin Flp [Rhodovulum euryhalinum]
MKLFDMIKRFRSDESGAVTVDWVVLTAAIVGLGIAVLSQVKTGVDALAVDIKTSLTSAEVKQLGSLGWGNGTE